MQTINKGTNPHNEVIMVAGLIIGLPQKRTRDSPRDKFQSQRSRQQILAIKTARKWYPEGIWDTAELMLLFP